MEGRVVSLEKKIEKKVCEYAKTKGFLTLKINVVGERGWPDRLLIDPDGWPVWIEFKAPGKEPDPIQIHRHGQLATRNHFVIVIDNEEEGIELIDNLVASRIPDESDEDAPLPGERRIITGPGIREN
jgi:hypothetical protein